MAALTVTVAEVLPTGSGAEFDRNYLSAVTITAGQVVYKDANSVWRLAQCDGTAIESGSGTIFGFAMHAALAGQPLAVQVAGIFVVGATAAPTVGVVYCIGRTAGAIVPITDLASTDKQAILAVCASSSTLDMAVKRCTGYTIP